MPVKMRGKLGMLPDLAKLKSANKRVKSYVKMLQAKKIRKNIQQRDMMFKENNPNHFKLYKKALL